MIEGRSFHMDQIVGNRSERKEWMTYFQHADSFLFVVSLTSYSQTSRRDTNMVSTDRSCVNHFKRTNKVPKDPVARVSDVVRIYQPI